MHQTPPAADSPAPQDPADRLDSLTGLARREALLAALEQRTRHRATAARPFALLAIDLDRFKAVNDTLGHPIGDALLRAVGRRIRSCIRGEDMAGRLGGDEFAVLLSSTMEPQAALGVADRLAEMMSRPFLLEGHSLVIGCSVGVAMFPTDGTDADTLLRAADLALYQAKAEGRGTSRRFVPALRARADARRALEADLRAAIGLGQFELHYQPLVEISSGRLSGFEALVRWRHPRRGLVPPIEFIPLAEEIGLIVAIGEWVLRTACAEAATWPGDLGIAVNVSAPQLTRGRLVQTVQAALADSGLAPGRLELELTETALLVDTDATIATCAALRALGVRIALDDFGTGYSSLTQLRDFPLDKVKIDRSFIAGITERADSAAIVGAVATLGSALGLRTTAEGVETAAQMRELVAHGCTEAQGYLLGRPMPAEQVRQAIRDFAACPQETP